MYGNCNLCRLRRWILQLVIPHAYKRSTLFLFTTAYGWRQVILDLGVTYGIRECVCTHVHVRASHCSLQLRVTSRVQTMSFRFARLRILSIPLFLPYNAISHLVVSVSVICVFACESARLRDSSYTFHTVIESFAVLQKLHIFLFLFFDENFYRVYLFIFFF